MGLMIKPQFSLSLLLVLVFSACATPNVIVDVMKKYPPQPVDSVKVFHADDWIPNSAENLGRVLVLDGRISTDFEQAVGLARERTASVGGNGVIVSMHEDCVLGNTTCPSVAGQMLYLKDMKIDTLAYNPVMEALKEVEFRHEDLRRRIAVPRHTFYVQGGYTWCINELYSGADRLNPWGMSEWKMAYNYATRSGWGVGGVYAFLHRQDSRYDIQLDIHTLLPTFSYTLRHDKWMFQAAAGAGVGWVHQNEFQNCRLVVYTDLRIGYMITSRWGVNLGTGAFSFYNCGGKIRDFQNVGLEGGVQFYF